jgi:hypothetical protein
MTDALGCLASVPASTAAVGRIRIFIVDIAAGLKLASPAAR